MRTVLANQLSNVRVVSTDGREVGTLQNITVNTTTGELQTIVINSDIQEIYGAERDSDGDIRLPASLIESMRDHLTIQPPAEQRVAGGDTVDS
ncbi:PRC-barrel domain-containing protein [Haloarcula sp. NS06]|uniref:PRC-barrel domain-containing protein n=1 Tax=unclassified Haloarcula TaxID=2624677 RepID=UPI0027B02923|nr:PRC-barrel domain-containing protein [Haloarcula sp. H-GB4]MDQ2074318.1 PRC-barrel domain-containing protein [Haloarcula sp. H-GB4]